MMYLLVQYYTVVKHKSTNLILLEMVFIDENIY